jgi:hypothetical protein
MPYLSFLLRLWQAQQNESLVWRASLESPQTGERRSFPDLESLLLFLQDKTSRLSQPLETPINGLKMKKTE